MKNNWHRGPRSVILVRQSQAERQARAGCHHSQRCCRRQQHGGRSRCCARSYETLRPVSQLGRQKRKAPTLREERATLRTPNDDPAARRPAPREGDKMNDTEAVGIQAALIATGVIIVPRPVALPSNAIKDLQSSQGLSAASRYSGPGHLLFK